MENSELKQLKPLKNKYTRMIYDAKSTKKHREKTQKLKNKFVSKTTKKTKTSKTVKPVKTNKPPKVVNFSKKFKKSGLSQLIGKIAQRASKTATIVKSQGVKPSNSSRAGRAFSSVSKSKLKNSKVKSNLKSFKLNSVSTIGAGSAAKLKGLDGLASGSVGQANVGIIEEDTDVQGGLAREIIARTIRENLGQIRYCYERQLSANPELYGKLLVKFVIGPNGQVASQQIGTSTMNSAMVEGCILRRIAKWKFPKPDGGTNVRVSYPFLFKSTN